jgi:hypothetical protein
MSAISNISLSVFQQKTLAIVVGLGYQVYA